MVYREYVGRKQLTIFNLTKCTWKITANKGKHLELYNFYEIELQVFDGPCFSDKKIAYEPNEHSFQSRSNVIFLSVNEKSRKDYHEIKIEAVTCKDGLKKGFELLGSLFEDTCSCSPCPKQLTRVQFQFYKLSCGICTPDEDMRSMTCSNNSLMYIIVSAVSVMLVVIIGITAYCVHKRRTTSSLSTPDAQMRMDDVISNSAVPNTYVYSMP